MDGERIDWSNLAPLPRRKSDNGASRDDLAERKFHVQKGKHKGRNHVSNQKRRHNAHQKAEAAKKRAEESDQQFRSYKDAVRAYFAGEIDTHP